MAFFKVGDLVKFRLGHGYDKKDHKITKVYSREGIEYYAIDGMPSGWFPHRLELATMQVAPLNAEEYEEILEGQEIYQKLQGDMS